MPGGHPTALEACVHCAPASNTQPLCVLARPMQAGAARLSMVGFPQDLFVEAVKQTVAANQDYVPPQGKGSLYLRPLLFGSGPILGLGACRSVGSGAGGSGVALWGGGGPASPCAALGAANHLAAPLHLRIIRPRPCTRMHAQT